MPTSHVLTWAEALEQCHAWLRRVALARGGEAAAVDDIMQDVAVAAAENHGRLRDPTRVESWLYRLTVTAALHYRRRCGRRRKLIERAVEREPTRVETDPTYDWLVSDEQTRLVRQALERLPPKDAEILLLKYADDCKYHELAERLGISPSAVDGRLQRARRRLRSELMPYAEEAIKK